MSRVDRALNSALAGQNGDLLDLTASELLAEPATVAAAIGSVLSQPGAGLTDRWAVHQLLRHSHVYDDLLDSLASPNPTTRAAAARICGAARISESVLWLGDLVQDPSPEVREAAVRALAEVGGRRAVEHLITSAASLPVYRLAIALARAASDLDIEALIRQPASEHAAVATVMACGLRRDVLRVSALLGIAHDRRWPKNVRLAACKALAMIGDRAAADGLHRLADTDPDPTVKKAAERSYKRLLRRAVGRSR